MTPSVRGRRSVSRTATTIYGRAMELTAEEQRVLGCLVEKGATTPDQYPLSTNALVNACNQKSNRDPVVDYGERQVVDAMLEVRRNGLARTNSSGRTDKHRHILGDALGLDDDRIALLGVLLLRGPQSAGELRARTERYPTSQGHGFGSLDDVEALLVDLSSGLDPLVANVGRAAGQSQDRWAHLLGDGAPAPAPVTGQAGSTDGPTLSQRVADLEARLARLETELGLGREDGSPGPDGRVDSDGALDDGAFGDGGFDDDDDRATDTNE